MLNSAGSSGFAPGVELHVVVMAAGKGTRMKSAVPKVLHRLAGRALLDHVLDTAAGLKPLQCIVVTGHGAAEVEASLGAREDGRTTTRAVRQEPQLGTGHAVQQALPHLPDDGVVLVLSGDVPLIEADTLASLIAPASRLGRASAGEADAVQSEGALVLLTMDLPNPAGYGRIVRSSDGQQVQAIIEHKDATEAQRAITEVYSGILAAPSAALKTWLAALTNDNAQGEYYLTDVVRLAVASGHPVLAHRLADVVQVAGVNTPAQLAELERAWQQRHAQSLMAQGVRLADPARLDVRGTLRCGQDVEIDVNCVFEGDVVLGDGVRVGAHCVLKNVHVAAGAAIHPFTHIEGGSAPVQVGAGATVGPFARLRPGTVLGAQVHIGNFVEVKNSTLAAGAKANHLAYLGDATVGERVNYGAGSITANYDGANKHRTVIEDDVHVGSNCVLVAPITVGAGGTVGAGSTLTKSTAPGALTVARGKAMSVTGYKRPSKA